MTEAADSPQPKPTEIIPECPHRLEQVKTIKSGACGMRGEPIPIYGCSIHKHCTIRKIKCGSERASCLSCKDRPDHDSLDKPMKVIFRNKLSPGDTIMMTAAVRELYHQHPGKYLIDVRTPTPEIWENNPYLTPLKEDDPDVFLIDAGYDEDEWYSVNRSNQNPVHFVECYCADFSRQLGIPLLKPLEFSGDIHLSSEEKSWVSQAEIGRKRPTEYWIVCSGGKPDFTVKHWPHDYYQEVVNATKGRINWVQVGHKSHLHKPLDNVINLIGKTNFRELIRLVYNSSGVLCGVTALMHLAAAVENHPKFRDFYRPAFIIGGGREPTSWYSYPGHQIFHSVGSLDCCSHGGCWRSRTVPLGDGQNVDRNLCKYPGENDHPECMNSITPEMVIRSMERYI